MLQDIREARQAIIALPLFEVSTLAADASKLVGQATSLNYPARTNEKVHVEVSC